MVQINNSQLSKELIDGAKIQTSFNQIPTQLSDKVVAVMEVNPKLLRRSDLHFTNVATNATSATIYTTPTNADFYMTSANLSMIKDVTSTSLSSFINAFTNGTNKSVIKIASLTLTVQTAENSISIEPALKIDRGTVISVGNSTNVGNITSAGQFTGYLVYD